MELSDCLLHLKRSILSFCPVKNDSLTKLLDIFSPITLSKNDIFSNAGDYSSSFAFICNGVIQEYYLGHANNEIIKNLFVNDSFVIPLPSFIYRKPSYLNYKAITKVDLLQAKFSKLEELMHKHPSIYKFSRALIEREWVINRELHESGFHIYNNHTRFRIFLEKYHNYIEMLEPCLISSFLQIPVKQVEKLLQTAKPTFEG